MWLFTKRDFFSIVKHAEQPDILIVRARVEGDIQKYWPKAHVIETYDSDYRYRAFIHVKSVSEKIKDIVETIDYTNFKANIDDRVRRGPFYTRVWHIMLQLQNAILRRKYDDTD